MQKQAGFNDDEVLVIIDLDMRLNPFDEGVTIADKFLNCLYDGLRFLTPTFIPTGFNLPPLSKNDIQKMHKIYLELSQFSFFEINFNFGLNKDIYNKLLKLYIAACEDVIALLDNHNLLKEYRRKQNYAEDFINFFFVDRNRYFINFLFVDMCYERGINTAAQMLQNRRGELKQDLEKHVESAAQDIISQRKKYTK